MTEWLDEDFDEDFDLGVSLEEPEWREKEPKKKCGFRVFRPNDGLVAAFLVPVAVMLIVFAQRGIFPFGDESFLRTDMYHQYAPFFSEFQYKLRHGGSLLYSWDIGMGVNFSALYAYYLASPFNWLLILCPKGAIIEFMTYGIVLKTGLCGLSMAWYLRKHTKTGDFGVGFFGAFYALSGYMAAYSWNIMWLDCIILFPVILLGLEWLVREGKPFLYCISLGASILSNYYISIMICIFLVMYFVAQMVLDSSNQKRFWWRSLGQFAAASLAAGGLAAMVLLPEIFALQATASGDLSFPTTLSSYFSIFDMIARHIGNVQTEIGLDHWPNIYCGVAVFLFFFLYLGDKKIPLREKAVYCTLFVIFYASFSTNVLNFIWHGFHYPNSLPCRQSFIYIALMLTVCYRAYAHLDETPWKNVAIAFGASVAFVILAEKLVDNTEQFHFAVFYAALLFLALYTGLIWLYQNRKHFPDLVILATMALVCIESAVNLGVTSIPTTNRTSYIRDNQEIEDLVASIQPTTFYRVEMVDRRTKNDGAWMNFPSVSLFSSTADASLTDFFKKLGCESSTNAYSITGSTPLIDSLFSVKYALDGHERKKNVLIQEVGAQGETWLYENQFTLPVAFVLPDSVESNWQLDLGNPADVQNDLARVLDQSSVLVNEDALAETKAVSLITETPGEYYAYVTSSGTKKVQASIGEEVLTFDNVDRGYLLELGRCQAGEEIRLTSNDENAYGFQAEIYRFDEKNFESVYESLNEQPLTVTSWTDTSIAGTVSLKQAGTLFTSIPFDAGWTARVDGNPVKVREIFDTFVALDLEAGDHTVTFSYEPRGLRVGALITIVSVAFVGGWIGFYVKKHKYE